MKSRESRGEKLKTGNYAYIPNHAIQILLRTKGLNKLHYKVALYLFRYGNYYSYTEIKTQPLSKLLRCNRSVLHQIIGTMEKLELISISSENSSVSGFKLIDPEAVLVDDIIE